MPAHRETVMARARQRPRKALGSNPETHSRLAKDYLRKAKRDFEVAQTQENCRPTLGRLVDAQSNYVRAYEHTVAAGVHPPAPMISFGQKIHDAITVFSEGPCMRRSPYDKG
jgi:hypothetical protein